MENKEGKEGKKPERRVERIYRKKEEKIIYMYVKEGCMGGITKG